MKKVFLFCLSCLLTTTTTVAYETTPKTSKLQIGTEIYRESYKEYMDNTLFMREDAAMFGLYTKAHLPFHTLHAVDLLARMAVGSSRYTGALQNEGYGSYVSSHQDRYVWEARGIYAFNLPFALDWSPLLGLGYRKLVDRLDQIEEGGYKRTSQYVYATTGMKGNITLGSWHLAPQFLYHYLLHGKQQSKQNGDVIEHTQHSGHGFELAGELIRPLSHKESISITPYYKYWDIAKSDISYQFGLRTIEPKNKTHEIGLRMAYSF